MLTTLIVSGCLMAACVAVHAVGAIAALRWLDHSRALENRRFWPATRVVIALAGWIIGGHFIDVTLWALFYKCVQALPTLEAAVYFSAVTYTTVGYGDVVLPHRWRLSAGVEALTGILMCGWSTAAFFSVVSRMDPLGIAAFAAKWARPNLVDDASAEPTCSPWRRDGNPAGVSASGST